MRKHFFLFFTVCCFAIIAQAKNKQDIKKFFFGTGETPKGAIQITDTTEFSEEKGYGLKPSGEMIANMIGSKTNFVHSKKPFYFTVNLPEGHYRILLTLGGNSEKSLTCVKAESRRLMLENIKTEKGKTVQKTIIVDVRSPQINSEEKIKLKDIEKRYLNWDNKLTLEFTGENPSVSAVEIQKSDELPTIFLAGNSTLTDWEHEPYTSWGQIIPRFLKPNVVLANYAEAGETLLGFKREKRLQKLLSQMKKGDYMLVDFVHNDQKPDVDHLDALTTYKAELKYYISEARKKGGIVILVTPINRRRFDENGKITNSFEDFPEAMRQTAAEEKVALIDMCAISKTLFEALGTENSKKAFLHYPANSFPGQDKPKADDTHFSPYGSYELAQCMVACIIQQKSDLKKFLIDPITVFDPNHPDAFTDYNWSVKPYVNALKPVGN